MAVNSLIRCMVSNGGNTMFDGAQIIPESQNPALRCTLQLSCDATCVTTCDSAGHCDSFW